MKKRGIMTFLEIITVRLADKKQFETILGFCKQVSNNVGAGKLTHFRIYRDTDYGCDISVHLLWTVDLPSQKKSLLGIQLARSLSDFGIVSHTLWIDQYKFAGSNNRTRG
ncbi:hypothetical protein EG833_02330 [archaeon]|nr:hypothetical protein [archaeon]